MKHIHEQLKRVNTNLATIITFAAKHVDKLDKDSWFEDLNHVCRIYLKDVTAAGENFGTDGWRRRGNYDTTFDWEKTVDGVVLRILNAEDPQLNGSPVPPKAFPLALASDTTE